MVPRKNLLIALPVHLLIVLLEAYGLKENKVTTLAKLIAIDL